MSRELVACAIEPVTRDGGDGIGYGRGVKIDGRCLMLSGSDHGVSARSSHDPTTGITVTALANVETRVIARTRAAMDAAISEVGL